MWLRNLFGLPPTRLETLETAFDPVEINVNSPMPQAFREFTPPPRRQVGGAIRLGARHGDRLGRIGIVPLAGVKVP